MKALYYVGCVGVGELFYLDIKQLVGAEFVKCMSYRYFVHDCDLLCLGIWSSLFGKLFIFIFLVSS